MIKQIFHQVTVSIEKYLVTSKALHVSSDNTMYKVNQVQMSLQTNVPSGKNVSKISGCSPEILHVSPDKQVKYR